MNTVQLGSGEYWGAAKSDHDHEGLRVTLTRYAPHQSQPWHTHYNPTVFLQVLGDHRDCTPGTEQIQPSFTLNYHPNSLPHRSEVGPSGMAGVNIELGGEWLQRFGMVPQDLGKERIVDASRSGFLALKLVTQSARWNSDPAGLELLVFELLEPLFAVPSPEEANCPGWLRKAEDMIEERFADGLSLNMLTSNSTAHEEQYKALP